MNCYKFPLNITVICEYLRISIKSVHRKAPNSLKNQSLAQSIDALENQMRGQQEDRKWVFGIRARLSRREAPAPSISQIAESRENHRR